MNELPINGESPTVSGPDWQKSIWPSGAMPEIEGYKVIDKLGEGGMGIVLRAVQLSTQREVALKVMGSGIFSSKKAQSRFEREVELAARLEHTNIARVYDSGLHRGLYYYAMELIKGQHLDKYVMQQELGHRQILELMQKVCQAVKHAHQRGVIHRDLKPSNILVTEDGQPHVLDFGLAKALLVEEGDKGRTVSVDGESFGTPPFMSPEQAAGHINAIDTRTDVYSLGVILFCLLTNELPYDVSGPYYEVLRNIQEYEPIRPSRIVPGFDTDIEAIVLQTLAKKPCDRYQSSTPYIC
jgi:serine/threonine protein kinase